MFPAAVVVAIVVAVVWTIAKEWLHGQNRHPGLINQEQLRARRGREARWDTYNPTDRRNDRHWS
jgi:hypothetical protein